MIAVLLLFSCSTAGVLPDDAPTRESLCDTYLAVQASCPGISWMSTYSDTDQCARAGDGTATADEEAAFQECGSCLVDNQDSDCATISNECGVSCG